MKTTVIFGRLNPPHEGHYRMLKWARNRAFEQDSALLIFPTKTQNKKTDPLSYEDKVTILGQMSFGFDIGHAEKYTFFDVIESLEVQGYTEIEFVCGGDQFTHFNRLVNDYGHDYEAKLSVAKFEERDKYPISATMMREYCRDGNWSKFTEHAPSILSPNQKLEMFRKVSVALQGHVRPNNAKAGFVFASSDLRD